MRAFKIKNSDKLKGVFIGFVKGEYVELFSYGKRVRLNINEVEPVQII
jgi:hypothetical protein